MKDIRYNISRRYLLRVISAALTAGAACSESVGKPGLEERLLETVLKRAHELNETVTEVDK